MKKFVALTAVAVVFALSATGCGFVADGPFGWGYTANKTAVSSGPAKTGVKKGSACVTAFFGFVSLGDASIEAAMKDGGIKQNHTVNKENMSVVGVYSKQCTLVTGE